MPVKIFDFKGQKPIIAPRLLPLGYAQTAVNVKLGSGAMECFRAPGASVASVSSPETIYKFGSTWLSWSSRRWIEKAAVSGTDRILIANGATYPVVRNSSGTERRWGVVAPTTALTMADQGTAAENAVVVDTPSYVYTLVTSDGEESAPSPASPAVDIMTGNYFAVYNWCVYSGNKSSWLSITGNDIQYIRVYRLVSDSAGNAEYQRVSLRPTPTGSAVSQLTVTDISAASMYWYDANSAQDGLSEDLGEMIVTEGWDPPPAAMNGACMFANGMYAGWVGRVVYLSMPGYYYAFPASGTMDYTMELPYEVVGLAAFNESLVVGTSGSPEVISGTDPAFMTRTPLPYQQPCLSGKGMVSLPDGVAYVSPDGLFFVSSGGGDVLTKNVIDRDDWQALPLTAAMLAYHDQKIFIFFDNYSYGYIYDRALDYLVRIEPGFSVYDVFVDPVADVLYLASSSGVYAWEGSASAYLTAEWKSGVIEVSPVNFAGIRVEGSYPSGHATILTYYVDGDLKHTQTVTDDAPFRLPSGFRGRDHELRVVFSKSTLNAMYMAFNFGDLANV